MMNSVAFDRRLLLAHPIPTTLPLYRGNCRLHGILLRDNGVPILTAPAARCFRPNPVGFSNFSWRFLHMGE